MNNEQQQADAIDWEKAGYLLKAIGHPVRLQVISLLSQHEQMTVNDLVRETGCEQSLLSHHLIGMRLKGILTARKEGLFVHYALRERNVVKILDCIRHCDCIM
jgi:ArsR family transcriptional regulator